MLALACNALYVRVLTTNTGFSSVEDFRDISYIHPFPPILTLSPFALALAI